VRSDPRAPGLLLGEGVRVGAEVTFGAYVVVHEGTLIGDGCTIEDHVVLGKRPRLAKGSSAQGEVGALELAAGVTVCAGAVILAHNHPSGVAEPSQDDRTITLRLRDALGLIDVRVLDHIVVGDGLPISLAERGWL